jgi:hypothetical protein
MNEDYTDAKNLIGLLDQKVDLLNEAIEAGEVRPLFGCSVPIAGWAPVAEFQTKTGRPIEITRVYPGSRPLGDLSPVKKSISLYPNAGVCFNPKLAGKPLTQTQIDDFAKMCQIEATKVPSFVLVPDAEPDRVDRPYNATEFCNKFIMLSQACANFAPDVEVSLNLTGYDFMNRIGNYDRIRNLYDTLSLDPYWKTTTPSTVQGGTKDLQDAQTWCKIYGKKMALAEWGVEGGDSLLLAKAMTFIRGLDIAFSCYYQENQAPIPAALSTPMAYAVYSLGAS